MRLFVGGLRTLIAHTIIYNNPDWSDFPIALLGSFSHLENNRLITEGEMFLFAAQ